MATIRDTLFGTMAVRGHFVLPEQVEECLAIQRSLEAAGKKVPRLGEILAAKGYMTPDQVRAVLEGQHSLKGGLFGEIAIRWKFCLPDAVEACLKIQREADARGERPKRLGELLVERGALRPHQVHAILQAQGKRMACCTGCSAWFNVSNARVGASFRCPRCGTTNWISASEGPEARARHPVEVGRTVWIEPIASGPPKHDLPAAEEQATGRPSPTAAVKPANQIGPYEVLARLGGDATGALYKARHIPTGTTVCLKVLSAQESQDETRMRRWISAGTFVSQLEHPNLQKTIEVGSFWQRAYVAMEYIEGESLRRCVETRGPMKPLEAVDCAIQISEALTYAHDRGFFHGDIKPSHILLGNDGVARLSGMGLPKNVAANVQAMLRDSGEDAVPLFLAPEMAVDESRGDERTDIYSLGAVMYFALTGRAPYSGNSALEVLMRVAAEDLLPVAALDPNIPPYLSRIVEKMLSKEPEDRYASAEELRDDLFRTRAAIIAGAPDVPTLPSGGLAAVKAAESAPASSGQTAATSASRPSPPRASRWTARQPHRKLRTHADSRSRIPAIHHQAPPDQAPVSGPAAPVGSAATSPGIRRADLAGPKSGSGAPEVRSAAHRGEASSEGSRPPPSSRAQGAQAAQPTSRAPASARKTVAAGGAPTAATAQPQPAGSGTGAGSEIIYEEPVYLDMPGISQGRAKPSETGSAGGASREQEKAKRKRESKRARSHAFGIMMGILGALIIAGTVTYILAFDNIGHVTGLWRRIVGDSNDNKDTDTAESPEEKAARGELKEAVAFANTPGAAWSDVAARY
ncbi:MAG: protein kinase, partial [Planctomycetota bacterium]|nr:protein kinase [Planctomycetota bacterium]